MRFVIVFFCIVVGAFVFFYFFHDRDERNDPSFTLTKALCEGTTCRDYEIRCEGEQVISMAPLTGFVTFPSDWKDTRESKALCTP